MHTIFSTNTAQSKTWLTAIAKKKSYVDAVMAQIPETPGVVHVLKAGDTRLYAKWPVFLIENADGTFQMLNRTELVAWLLRIKGTWPKDREDTTIYKFEGPYKSRVLGKDDMGAIHHTHLDYDWFHNRGMEVYIKDIGAWELYLSMEASDRMLRAAVTKDSGGDTP